MLCVTRARLYTCFDFIFACIQCNKAKHSDFKVSISVYLRLPLC